MAWGQNTRAGGRAESTGARLILGINLEANRPAIAAIEARHLVDGIGRRHIEALEIGNEPELYNALPWYHAAGGRPCSGARRATARLSVPRSSRAWLGRFQRFRWPVPRPLERVAVGRQAASAALLTLVA